MPIYEFYCDSCNVIFNFLSARVNTAKKPDCPRCGKKQLERKISTFATIGKAKEGGGDPLAGLDETKMERAFESLLRESEHINEDDPKQMASLMRKFTTQTGINLGGPMEEALSRMEAGEDPDQVEKDMGQLFDEENIGFELVKKKALQQGRPPIHDEKFYEL